MWLALSGQRGQDELVIRAFQRVSACLSALSGRRQALFLFLSPAPQDVWASPITKKIMRPGYGPPGEREGGSPLDRSVEMEQYEAGPRAQGRTRTVTAAEMYESAADVLFLTIAPGPSYRFGPAVRTAGALRTCLGRHERIPVRPAMGAMYHGQGRPRRGPDLPIPGGGASLHADSLSWLATGWTESLEARSLRHGIVNDGDRRRRQQQSDEDEEADDQRRRRPQEKARPTRQTAADAADGWKPAGRVRRRGGG